jgi:hypothetical protein
MILFPAALSHAGEGLDATESLSTLCVTSLTATATIGAGQHDSRTARQQGGRPLTDAPAT